MASPRGQFTTGTSRTGAGFNYGGRNFRYPGAAGLRLDWKGPDVERLMNEVVDAVAKTLVTRGQAFGRSIAPVDTGFYRDHFNVRLSQEGSRVKITIEDEASYSVFLEVGTAHMAARPTMRRTLDYIS